MTLHTAKVDNLTGIIHGVAFGPEIRDLLQRTPHLTTSEEFTHVSMQYFSQNFTTTTLDEIYIVIYS